jgi:hypothetical protein
MRAEFPDSHSLRGFGPVSSTPADPAVGDIPQTGALTDEDKARLINRAHQAMHRAFLRWHFENTFNGAAAYDEARKTWEAMLMKWGQP